MEFRLRYVPRMNLIAHCPKHTSVHARLAPEFPRARASEPRVNGGEGMSAGFNAETWRLQVVGVADPSRYSQYRPNIAYETAMDNMNAGSESSERHENPDAKTAPGAVSASESDG
ncbi:MAG: hypothetical protein WKF84_08985 [Pyrinomonadaceae bacterium]